MSSDRLDVSWLVSLVNADVTVRFVASFLQCVVYSPRLNVLEVQSPSM